jgi:type IV pilus assembly protein PilA
MPLRSRIPRRFAAADGFTLVELLVVILIIGVLAAIALGTFLNQRSKAQDTHAKTNASTAAQAMLVFEHDHGSFAGATPAALIDIEPSLAGALGLDVDSTADAFTVTAGSAAAAGATFSVEHQSTGKVVHACSLPGVGSCRADLDADGNRW